MGDPVLDVLDTYDRGDGSKGGGPSKPLPDNIDRKAIQDLLEWGQKKIAQGKFMEMIEDDAGNIAKEDRIGLDAVLDTDLADIRKIIGDNYVSLCFTENDFDFLDEVEDQIIDLSKKLTRVREMAVAARSKGLGRAGRPSDQSYALTRIAARAAFFYDEHSGGHKFRTGGWTRGMPNRTACGAWFVRSVIEVLQKDMLKGLHETLKSDEFKEMLAKYRS